MQALVSVVTRGSSGASTRRGSRVTRATTWRSLEQVRLGQALRLDPDGARFLHLSWRNRMLRKLMLIAATLAVPALLAAQDIPNSHASDTAKSKVAAHRQNPQVPAQEASDTAKSKVAQHRASKVRGSAAGTANRPVTPATPAVPGNRAPALPAVPASPS